MQPNTQTYLSEHQADLHLRFTACRLPGGVSSSSEFWEFLAEGRSGQCDIPLDRFNASAFYHQKGLTRPGSMTTKGGYFLREDPRLFDHEFFDILPLEAMYSEFLNYFATQTIYLCYDGWITLINSQLRSGSPATQIA